MRFTDKIALITGAAVGIGRATAILLAKEGAKLILLDVNFEKLESVKEELSEYTDQVLVYHCDISDEERVNAVISEALTQFGRIDILVNNAALWRCNADFIDTPPEEWRRFFDINVMGTVYVTKAVLPSMKEHHYGRVINVASVAGIYGNPKMVHYSATKGAVISFTKALAKEVVDSGILVNAVSPGSVSPAEDPDIDYFKASQLSYMGRTGTDRENAELICFLASDAASYIAGENIQIDGCRKKL